MMLTMMLIPALKAMGMMLAYIAPGVGLMFGESAQAYDDERYQDIQVIDLGTLPYREGDELLLDIAPLTR